jgi:hypothetical protein
MKTEQSPSNYVTLIYNWLRYSGIAVIVQGNPLHWRLVPWAREERNLEWPVPNEHTWAAGWLFVTVRVWIDNGDW